MQNRLEDGAGDDIAVATPVSASVPLPPPPPVVTRTPATPPRREATAIARAAWGLLGFLVGALFWHFVGFWGFVGDVVFNRQAVSENRQIAQTGTDCVSLVRDPASGMITAEACPSQAPSLSESASTVKQDFGGPRGGRHYDSIRVSAGSR